ncbi:hypothetical protein IAR50_006362 [Cryptococcus sp. DSM 104548]
MDPPANNDSAASSAITDSKRKAHARPSAPLDDDVAEFSAPKPHASGAPAPLSSVASSSSSAPSRKNNKLSPPGAHSAGSSWAAPIVFDNDESDSVPARVAGSSTGWSSAESMSVLAALAAGPFRVAGSASAGSSTGIGSSRVALASAGGASVFDDYMSTLYSAIKEANKRAMTVGTSSPTSP